MLANEVCDSLIFDNTLMLYTLGLESNSAINMLWWINTWQLYKNTMNWKMNLIIKPDEHKQFNTLYCSFLTRDDYN